MLFGNKVASHQEIIETMLKVPETLDYLRNMVAKILVQKPQDSHLKTAIEQLSAMSSETQKCMGHINYKGLKHT